MSMRRRIDIKVGQRQFIMYDDRTCRLDDMGRLKTIWYRTNQLRWWKRMEKTIKKSKNFSIVDQCLLDTAWLKFMAPAHLGRTT